VVTSDFACNEQRTKNIQHIGDREAVVACNLSFHLGAVTGDIRLRNDQDPEVLGHDEKLVPSKVLETPVCQRVLQAEQNRSSSGSGFNKLVTSNSVGHTQIDVGIPERNLRPHCRQTDSWPSRTG